MSLSLGLWVLAGGNGRLLALVCRAEGLPGGSSGHGPGAGEGLYPWECKISPLSAAASADSCGVWTTASRQTLWLHETNRHNSITPICLNRHPQAPAVPTDNQLPLPEIQPVLSEHIVPTQLNMSPTPSPLATPARWCRTRRGTRGSSASRGSRSRPAPR